MSSAERCLQLDVGNSSAKWRLLEGDEIVARGLYRSEDEQSRDNLLACSPRLDAIWISSVAKDEAQQELSAMLRRQWQLEPWLARSEAETLGLINSYSEPQRMGVDRWLAMLAARQRYTGRLCVVDAGSALTIDIVAAEGRHEGGYIIPGPQLMERALLLDTDRVRFAETAEYALQPGESTAEAVRHGIALAQAGAVTMALNLAGSEPLKSIFTGGGGQWLQRHLNYDGEYVADLVLDGLQCMGRAR